MIKQIQLKILIIFFFIIFSKSHALENRIVLKVENEIITTLDIFNEIKELKFFNKNLALVDNESEIYQIALQSILRYKIKKIEVLKNFDNFQVFDESYLNDLVKKKYQNLGFNNLNDFKESLKKNEINYTNFKEKLKINLFWNEIIYSKYFKNIRINEKKLKNQIDSKKNFSKSYNLNEIVYQAQNLKDIDNLYNIIKTDIKKLGFESAAIKHSVSDTSDIGGIIGWVDENSLDKRIFNELERTPLGSITKPIRISSGFMILQKLEEKEIINNLDKDAELKKLIQIETNKQLNNFSNIYFNKIKNNLKINAP